MDHLLLGVFIFGSIFRSTITNGNSLSSARKATRRRAMEKRGSGVGTESEDLMSDDITG